MTDHALAPLAVKTGHGGGRFRFDVLHHLLAATLLASSMLVMERQHWMDWLDAVMLTVVGTGVPVSSSEPQHLPQLVLIDAQTYAETFGTRSPLDRKALGQLLGEVLSAQPAELLVDLQLEPAPDELEPRALDQLLIAAAGPAAGRRAVRITLPLPIARTPALDRRSLAWLRQLCDAGIQFGTADLRSHFGTVVRLDLDPLSLAQVARPPQAEPHAEGHPQTAAGQVTLCSMARDGAALDVMWNMAGGDAGRLDSAPLDPALVKQLDARRINWRPGQTASFLRAGGSVVVGGAYDNQDSFVTSATTQPVPGALLHATGLANQGRDSSHLSPGSSTWRSARSWGWSSPDCGAGSGRANCEPSTGNGPRCGAPVGCRSGPWSPGHLPRWSAMPS